jgi:two-component system, OmpR family, response regulator
VAVVLIVDDTDIVRRALDFAVRRMGHSPVSTTSAIEAVALAVEARPDLALLDVRMPDMDGAQLLLELRRSLGDRCPKVLWISGSPAEEVAERTAAAGPAAGFVRKPFHLDELIRTVETALAPAPET